MIVIFHKYIGYCKDTQPLDELKLSYYTVGNGKEYIKECFGGFLIFCFFIFFGCVLDPRNGSWMIKGFIKFSRKENHRESIQISLADKSPPAVFW